MKRLTALVCALFMFILLGSCSTATDGTKSENNAASSGAAPLSAMSESEDKTETDAASRTQSRQTIAIRVSLTPAEEDAMQMLADDFNASNGQGITVVVRNEYVADEDRTKEERPETDDAEDAAEADAVNAQTGGVPVALMLDDVKAVCATKGLQSLNEWIAAEYGNDPDVPASLRGAAEKAGEQFGVPFDLDGCVFYYNASLYDANDLEAPATWEELLNAGDVLTEEEDCPVMATDSLTDLADLLLRLSGVSLTDGERAGFSEETGAEAFSFLMDMLNEDKLLLADKGTCKELFLEGRTAGYPGNGSDLTDMYRNSRFDIGAVAMPHPEDTQTPAAPCTMRVLALYPGDEAIQEAAWEFVRYLTSAPVSARWAVATGRFPVRSAAYMEGEYTSYMETSVAANASADARYGYYLPEDYSEDLQYRVREIIGRNMKTNVTGSEICDILVQEINDSLAME